MKHLRNTPELKQRRQDLRRDPTDAEKAFWSYVRNRRFKGLKFFRQYSVGPYIIDFFCPAIKLAVELDGGRHNNIEGREYDAERSKYLDAKGVSVIRFWNREILTDIQAVLAKLDDIVTPLNPPLA